MQYKSLFKWAGLLFVVLGSVFLMGGCGKLDTTMVVDKNFSGTRTMVLAISDSDMNNYISTGDTGMKETIEAYIPNELTYKSTRAEGKTLYTFTLSFGNLEDYTTKVSAIFAATPNNTIKPNIFFESQSTEFKSGVVFNENFHSGNLLDWLILGLEKDGRVSGSYSSSSWYDISYNYFVFEGTEYKTYGKSGYDINKMESYHLSGITVSTKVLKTGGYERQIAFSIGKSTQEKMSERGVSLSTYFTELLPANGEISIDKDEKGTTTYTVSFVTQDGAALNTATNALLQAENSSFEISVSANKDYVGTADILVQEVLDGSYYLDTSSIYRVESNLYLFPGFTASEHSPTEAFHFSRDGEGREERINYWLESPDEKSEVLALWQISYEDVLYDLRLTNKIDSKLVLAIPSNSMQEIKDMSEAALQASLPEGVSFSQAEDKEAKKTVYTINFGKKKPEVAEALLNEFMKKYTSGQGSNYRDSKIQYYEAGTAGFLQMKYELMLAPRLVALSGDLPFTITMRTPFSYKILHPETQEKTNEYTIENTHFGIVQIGVRGINTLGFIVLAVVLLLILAVLLSVIILTKRKPKGVMVPSLPKSGYTQPDLPQNSFVQPQNLELQNTENHVRNTPVQTTGWVQTDSPPQESGANQFHSPEDSAQP